MINKIIFRGISIALILLLHFPAAAQNTMLKLNLPDAGLLTNSSEKYTMMSMLNKHYKTKFYLVSQANNEEDFYQQNTLSGFKLISSKKPATNAVVLIPFCVEYNSMNVTQIINRLQSVYDETLRSGNRCYILTPQPRTDGKFSQPIEKKKLAEIKDSILSHFGEQSIDLWDGFYNPEDTSLLARYDAGDGLHFNYEGQIELYNRVLDKNIFKLQSESIRTDKRTGQWFDIISPCIIYFAVFPKLIRELKEKVTESSN
jgi:hypothetical protein